MLTPQEEIRVLRKELDRLVKENEQLKKRPALFVITHENDELDRVRIYGSRARQLFVPTQTYHIEIRSEDGRTYEFRTAVCVGTPNCFVKTTVICDNEGNAAVIPTAVEVDFR